MLNNSKKSIKKMVLLFIGTAIAGGFAVLIFSILGNVCSQVITSAVTYYNAMMKQESPAP